MFLKLLLVFGTLFSWKVLRFSAVLSQTQRSNQILPFYGDILLEKYLQTICLQFANDRMMYSIILVQSLNTNRIPTKPSPFQIYLKCFHMIVHLPTSNLTVLMSQLKMENKLRHTKWLIIIDFDQKIDQKNFKQLMVHLDKLFWECIHCKPFIVHFHAAISQKIVDWSQESLKYTRKTFKLSLKFSISLQIIHIRPTYGCLISQTIFIPKTQTDFLQLKRSYKCDLQNSILNVSLNHIPPFCNLIIYQNNSIEISPKKGMEIEFLKSFMKSKYKYLRK